MYLHMFIFISILDIHKNLYATYIIPTKIDVQETFVLRSQPHELVSY